MVKRKNSYEGKVCEICNKVEAHHVHHKDGNHGNNKEENRQYLCTLCHADIEDISPIISELRRLVIMRDRTLTDKGAISNQISGFSRIGYVVPEHMIISKAKREEGVKDYDKQIADYLELEYKDNPVYQWAKGVGGVGIVTIGKLLAHIDFDKAPCISSVLRYCGQDGDYIDRKKKKGKGKATKKELKEYKKYGVPYLKAELLGVLAPQFLRKISQYYWYYWRERYVSDTIYFKGIDKSKKVGSQLKWEGKDGKVEKGIGHNRAKRKAVKEFIKDMYLINKGELRIETDKYVDVAGVNEFIKNNQHLYKEKTEGECIEANKNLLEAIPSVELLKEISA